MLNHTLVSQKKEKPFFLLCFMVAATLVGPLIYLEVASLYHFVILGLFVLTFFEGIILRGNSTVIIKFFFLWFAEAFVSFLWAPDKEMALQYIYYIFLLAAMCVVFHAYIINEKTTAYFVRFMVILLLICNIIAIWETLTGNHIAKGYVATPYRMRVLKYMPGTFFYNPNDSATYMIQILPFSIAANSSKNKTFSVLAKINMVTSFLAICAAQSRTQIILIIAIYVIYALAEKKTRMIGMVGFLLMAIFIISWIFPDINEVVKLALDSVNRAEIGKSALDGGSLSTRISLMKNGGHMLIDTFGVGVGAGGHRTLMREYSAMYYPTGGVAVMHNLLAEIFVDYGILIGSAFLVALTGSVKRLISIYKTATNSSTKSLSFSLAAVLATFVFCGVSSSSIIQLTSIWMTICFTSAFINYISKYQG